jgi:hypothetical protein
MGFSQIVASRFELWFSFNISLAPGFSQVKKS